MQTDLLLFGNGCVVEVELFLTICAEKKKNHQPERRMSLSLLSNKERICGGTQTNALIATRVFLNN
jgi:hypothetical protein